MNNALLIPCYEPGEKVVAFMRKFSAGEFKHFLIVDDGSGKEYGHIFDEIAKNTVFEVLSYEKNKGKGGALKTGIKHLLDLDKDLEFIVTADSDGQHTYEDVLRVRDAHEEDRAALVLGVRDFSGKDVPSRSRFGNRFSSLYFKAVTHVKVGDTQTGLRGIPSNLFKLALETKGERFEYEMNFLTDACRETGLIQLKIETVYEDKNKTSHFRAVRDSVRIYKTPIAYILISVLSFALDVALFAILSTYVFTASSEEQVFLSALIARVSSGLFNFLTLNFLVFNGNSRFGTKAVKYWFVWGVNYGLSSGLTYLFNFLPMALTFIKVIIDVILAVVNYLVNATWVFARKKRRAKTPCGKEVA